MSMLLTRLLNLDMHVVTLVHFKDKVVKDGDDEIHELMLQLQGEIKDTAVNDFTWWVARHLLGSRGRRAGREALVDLPGHPRPAMAQRGFACAQLRSEGPH